MEVYFGRQELFEVKMHRICVVALLRIFMRDYVHIKYVVAVLQVGD